MSVETKANAEPKAPSFESGIRPMFREFDRTSMLKAFDLWSYDDVVAHAAAILDRLKAGTMPCDGPWPERDVSLFASWIDQGARP
jgi:hypothetical protein